MHVNNNMYSFTGSVSSLDKYFKRDINYCIAWPQVNLGRVIQTELTEEKKYFK